MKNALRIIASCLLVWGLGILASHFLGTFKIETPKVDDSTAGSFFVFVAIIIGLTYSAAAVASNTTIKTEKSALLAAFGSLLGGMALPGLWPGATGQLGWWMVIFPIGGLLAVLNYIVERWKE